MKHNDPEDCPTLIPYPISILEMHRQLQSQSVCEEGSEEALERHKQVEQTDRAISLLKSHQSMCKCGPMPDDGNAALYVLEYDLHTHKELLVAYKGTSKGDHHAKCIREIEDALLILNYMGKELGDVLVPAETTNHNNPFK